MPRIFDNIDQSLLPALQQTLSSANRADFCVGYFNLRGWRAIDETIESWPGGPGGCCRLLVGMQHSPSDELRQGLSILARGDDVDQGTMLRWKQELADEFRRQLAFGSPNNADEAGLRRLAAQVRAKKVTVKLFMAHHLHAKLYLLFRPDPDSPTIGYLGSSNLTMAGLSRQGELNVDVMDHDACGKLARWFNDRWNDRCCLDISSELENVIATSWAREDVPPPYHIYLKMAYHLSREAREGVEDYTIPPDLSRVLLKFQTEAVKIAAHHVNKRGGVLIGDVVGLGKTLMATAVARIIEIEHGHSTLILCPVNLQPMWKSYAEQYGLHAKIVPFSKATEELQDVPARFRVVLIDESHNLRNREGQRYRAIQEYIATSGSKVILLSATPYNKTYLDLGSQLRLFVAEDADIGIRPEAKLRDMGEDEFQAVYQCPVRSLAAFEKSEFPDDWRELMRLYLVRRTRSFIQQHYSEDDGTGGKCLKFANGDQYHFPVRVPKTVRLKAPNKGGADQYAQLYSDDVVAAVERLKLPRYGLGNYVENDPGQPPSRAEAAIIDNLSRAGKRLTGYCRTNLFKRLESSGHAFLLSVERHILRNHVYLHALERGLKVPIGTQAAERLDTRFTDEDDDLFADDEGGNGGGPGGGKAGPPRTDKAFRERAAEVYAQYAGSWEQRFRWLPAARFKPQLAKDLQADCKELLEVLRDCGTWDADADAKLNALERLIAREHAGQKVLVFSQFADTVDYLAEQLVARGVGGVASVTGGSSDPTWMARRFSPTSNGHLGKITAEQELRVLVATDVLSEGQNLQDAAIVVNFDLPWAIIRLIQRAGRVDRIGQAARQILCYSFEPADGVERIIQLRSRVRQRLHENAEVVGTDERFFEDEPDDRTIRDLFTEKSGILDDKEDDSDLGSRAFGIWSTAIQADPSLEETIKKLPDVVFSTKPHDAEDARPEGVLVYVRTAEGNDALAWVDRDGRTVTESQYTILKTAACEPIDPALPRHENHHDLVRQAVQIIAREEQRIGGQLGPKSGAKYRVYTRLNEFAKVVEREQPVLAVKGLEAALEQMHRFPLRQAARDTLNRLLRAGARDEDLAEHVVEMHGEGRLCVVHEDEERAEPRIICSLGLRVK